MKNSQKGVIGIAISIIIGLAILGGGTYWLSNKKVTDNEINIQKDSTTQAISIKLAEEELRYKQGIEQRESTFSINFKVEAKEKDISSLKNTLQGKAGIKSIEFLSAEQALIEFRERHKDDETVTKALDELGYNPLGAKITVQLESSLERDSIIGWIKASPEYSSVDAITQ